VVIFNIGGALTGPARAFFQAELATYRAVFPQVHVFKVLPEMADSQVQNLMLVACRSAAPVALHSPDAEVAGWLANRVEVAGDGPWPMLTDDLAPVEHYNAYAQNHP
jgi:hypothetical protein